MYKLATGWLGWSHNDALNVHVGFIEAAFEGLIDKLNKTNPYASPETEKERRISIEDGDAIDALFDKLESQHAQK